MREGPNHSASAPEQACGELLGELQSGDEQQRVEVWLRRGPNGGVELELRQFLWGSGVGWYAQKSLTLDAAQAASLPGLLPTLPDATVSTPTAAPPSFPCRVVAGGAAPASGQPRERLSVERDGNAIRLRF